MKIDKVPVSGSNDPNAFVYNLVELNDDELLGKVAYSFSVENNVSLNMNAINTHREIKKLGIPAQTVADACGVSVELVNDLIENGTSPLLNEISDIRARMNVLTVCNGLVMHVFMNLQNPAVTLRNMVRGSLSGVNNIPLETLSKYTDISLEALEKFAPPQPEPGEDDALTTDEMLRLHMAASQLIQILNYKQTEAFTQRLNNKPPPAR